MGRIFSFEHRRAFGFHLGIPYSNSASKANDPHINLATLKRILDHSWGDIHSLAAINFANKVASGVSRIQLASLGFYNSPIIIIATLLVKGLSSRPAEGHMEEMGCFDYAIGEAYVIDSPGWDPPKEHFRLAAEILERLPAYDRSAILNEIGKESPMIKNSIVSFLSSK